MLRAVLNILVRNASPKGPMCFRCLIFNLSGPCELLFLLCFIASWTWEVVSVMLYPCMLCVALLMCLFVLCVACLTVFVNCLVKQFAMYLGVVAILLVNVMDVFSAAHTDTNPKNLELAPPQSVTATRLDQLVYSPNYYIQIFRT